MSSAFLTSVTAPGRRRRDLSERRLPREVVGEVDQRTPADVVGRDVGVLSIVGSASRQTEIELRDLSHVGSELGAAFVVGVEEMLELVRITGDRVIRERVVEEALHRTPRRFDGGAQLLVRVQREARMTVHLVGQRS